LLKGEGLPYEYLHLPSIQKAEELPVILSCEEIWRMLGSAQLLKHRIHTLVFCMAVAFVAKKCAALIKAS
jgi:hypothetical protein